jgi:pimeloyl-ACP methyl ester carboxylesterase
MRARLLTLPGFDGVPPLAQPTWAALAGAVVDELRDHDILAGHSMGGLIALLAAARAHDHGHTLRALVLLEPAIFPGALFARVAAARYLARLDRDERDPRRLDVFENWNGGMQRVHDLSRYPRAAIDQFLAARRIADRATGRALFATLAAQYPLPFAQVSAPALVVAGRATGWVGRRVSAYVTRELRARRIDIANAAHWLANEADDAVAAAITSVSGTPAT